MSMRKYASLENVQVLDLKGSQNKIRHASLGKLADFEEYRTDDGYLYARIRAISSRVNKNHDGWPSIELAGGQDIFDHHRTASGGFTITATEGSKYGFSTFLGKPIFVDHHNSDPKRTRGAIVDSKLTVFDHKTAAIKDSYWNSSDVDPEHLPPTEIELLLEIDAKSFPKFAKAVVEGSRNPRKGIDGWSMGCDVTHSICSICKNSATCPEEYCKHIQMKGAYFDHVDESGHKTSKKAYENCYQPSFFEISGVFDPADATALSREVRSKTAEFAEPGENPELDQWHSDLQDGMARSQEHMPEGDDLLSLTERYVAGDQQAGQIIQRITGQDPATFLEGMRKMFEPIEGYQEGSRGAQGYDNERFARFIAKELEDADPKKKPLKDLADLKNEEWLEDSGEQAKKRKKRSEYFGDEHFEEEPPPGMMSGALACPNCNGEGIDHEGQTCPMCQGHGHFNSPNPGSDGYGYDPISPGRGGIPTSELGPVRHGTTHLAENPLPQAEMVHAPEQIDTLREEEVCPVCGSSMDEETCDVCGYQEPPEGFGNPDLTKAQGEELRPENDEGIETPPEPQAPEVSQEPPHPVNTPNNPTSLAHVTGDDWDVHTSARINKFEEPIAATEKPQTNEPKEKIIKDQLKPVTSRIRTAEDFIAAATTRRNMKTAEKGAPPVATPDVHTEVEGVGGVDQASNEEASKADAQVDTLGIGGTGEESVSAEQEGVNVEQGDEHSKNIESIPTMTWSDGKGDSLGQQDPVTTEQPEWQTDGRWSHWHVEGHDDAPFPNDEIEGGTAVRGVKPHSETFGERGSVFDHPTSPANNSGPTKTWTGTEGNGVLKQQDPVTPESIALGESGIENAPNWTSSVHLFSAFKLADLEVEMGLISPDKKYERAAELESQSPQSVEASLKYAQRIKKHAHKTAGVQRLPVMGRPTQLKEASSEESTEDDSFMFGGV